MDEPKLSNEHVEKLDVVKDAEHQVNCGLTDEEKVVEKKLVRKIDLIIMPIILTVYLLNWIDRYVQFSYVSLHGQCTDVVPQKQLRFCATCWPGRRLWSDTSAVSDWTFHPLLWLYPWPNTI
jgi:hypothetical protein